MPTPAPKTRPRPPEAPDVAGTAWIGLEGHHWAIYRLEPDGTFDYENALGRWGDGTWRQVGDAVLLETRGHAADYRGRLRGETLEGRVQNAQGGRWTFRMVRAPGPARLLELSRWISKVAARKAPRR